MRDERLGSHQAKTAPFAHGANGPKHFIQALTIKAFGLPFTHTFLRKEKPGLPRIEPPNQHFKEALTSGGYESTAVLFTNIAPTRFRHLDESLKIMASKRIMF
jgi:hypothetical protein